MSGDIPKKLQDKIVAYAGEASDRATSPEGRAERRRKKLAYEIRMAGYRADERLGVDYKTRKFSNGRTFDEEKKLYNSPPWDVDWTNQKPKVDVSTLEFNPDMKRQAIRDIEEKYRMPTVSEFDSWYYKQEATRSIPSRGTYKSTKQDLEVAAKCGWNVEPLVSVDMAELVAVVREYKERMFHGKSPCIPTIALYALSRFRYHADDHNFGVMKGLVFDAAMRL